MSEPHRKQRIRDWGANIEERIVKPDLTRFLVSYTARPFIWGQDDCALYIADWWQANHGVDPAAALRGTYSDKEGKDAVVAAAGGIVALVSDLAAHAGAIETDDPERGDFGLVSVPNHPEPIAAIKSMRRFWAMRSEDGFVFLRSPTIVKAWRI